jgi:hypothetical protein
VKVQRCLGVALAIMLQVLPIGAVGRQMANPGVPRADFAQPHGVHDLAGPAVQAGARLPLLGLGQRVFAGHLNEVIRIGIRSGEAAGVAGDRWDDGREI